MKKIVIFDMDGTLVNSSEDITITINYIRKTLYALAPIEEQFVIDAINAHERNLAHLFYETEHYEQRAKTLFEEHYYEQCIEHTYSYPEIFETLEVLKLHGCVMSVATNAPSTFAKRMLAHSGISDFFSAIVGADNVEFPKPHAQMIDLLLDHHGYDRQSDKAWMVGDNSKDMLAARNANIGTIFAAWGFSKEGEEQPIAFAPSEISKIILEG